MLTENFNISTAGIKKIKKVKYYVFKKFRPFNRQKLIAF